MDGLHDGSPHSKNMTSRSVIGQEAITPATISYLDRSNWCNWWKSATCNPPDNGVVECMLGTLKKALQKFTQIESEEWDASLENVLYGYRRRPGADGVAPFEILFGVKTRFGIESSGAIPGEEVLTNTRTFELAMTLINRAERFVSPPFKKRRDTRLVIWCC